MNKHVARLHTLVSTAKRSIHGISPDRWRAMVGERSAADALAESERQFRAVFEQAAVGMAQVGIDGTLLRVNDRLCAIIGYAREELVGHRYQDLTQRGDLAGLLPERRALLAGVASTVSREMRYLRKDGTAVWVNITLTLLRHADGSPDRLLSVIEDISDRKRIELALQESEALLRAVLDQIPVAVAIYKPPEGTSAIRSRYSETLLGPLQDIALHGGRQTARHATEHADESPYALEENPSWRALYLGETVMAEPLLCRRADGRLMELEAYAAPVRDAAGVTIAAVTANFDVTERNQARRLLARSNAELEARVRGEAAARNAAQARAAHAERMQALGQLAGGIAHDFNNVLQAVDGVASLIERHCCKEAAVIRLMRQLTEAVDRGASITRRLLAFGRRGDLRAQPLDVAAMLDGMQEVFAHTLGTSIEVGVHLADALPEVLADKSQLETALINLATNARDAMCGGGHLTLAAAQEIVPTGGSAQPFGLAAGRYVRITVSDTGKGMSPETLAHATDPFFTTKPVGVGTGLGLSMVRGFAEHSGGAFAIASYPGIGTTVTLLLPAAEGSRPSSVAASQGGETASARPSGMDGARVLLVDDEAVLREVLAEQLGDAGCSVLVAASGSEALGYLTAGEAVDILVTDLSMPGMDGLAVIRAAQDARPDLPAVLLTGFSNGSVALAGAGEGAGPFTLLRKPTHLHELTERMQSLLATRCVSTSKRHARPQDAAVLAGAGAALLPARVIQQDLAEAGLKA